jgi:uncharacterized protein DUF3631
VFADKGVSFLSSNELVTELRQLEESPWNDFDFNPSKLAYRLREFGVRPRHSLAVTTRGWDRQKKYTLDNKLKPVRNLLKYFVINAGMLWALVTL